MTAGEQLRLRPYVARLAIDWLRESPDVSARRLVGTLAFVDVSGFTALTERLASRGKAGAEEIGEILDNTFAALLDVGYEYGAGLVKFGGDATLLFFSGDDHEARACRATALMVRAMKQIGRLTTSVGPVTLRVSVGVHSGDIDFFLVGTTHRELMVSGPAATATAHMESIAEAGEVVISAATAAALPARHVGVEREDGFLLRGVPTAPSVPARTPPDVSDIDVGLLLPAPIRAHLGEGGDDSAHRYATAGFIQVMGVDGALAESGVEAVTKDLADIVETTTELAARHGATFLGTDISADGVKLIVLGGVPIALGNDEEHVLRVVSDVVSSAPDRLVLRGGVNAGRMYVGDFGPGYRRAWSVMGDAVNLAARLMAKSGPGRVLASASLVDACRGDVQWLPVEPFQVKGKKDPVLARDVVYVGGRRQEIAATVDVIGRDAELAVLIEGAEQLRRKGLVLDVVAQPGMGKSTLLQEARRRWSLPVTVVACDEYETTTPYAAARRLLQQVLGTADALDDIADADRLSPELRRIRIEESVVALVRSVVTQPHIFLVEDAHAMDESSASLLGRLTVDMTDRPWLWAISRRPADAGFRPREAPHVRTIDLQPLPPAAAVALLDLDDEALRLPVHEQEALVERAGGNPLFLKVLVQSRLAAGPEFELPETLDGLLTAQIDRLAVADRRRLRGAAVLGVRFEERLLATVLSDYRSQAADWRRLSAFVVADGPGVWRFTHALVRDAAYEGLSFRDRRRLHEKAAVALQALPGSEDATRASLLSLHFFHAQRFEDALRYSETAADQALALYSNVEAAQLYRRAIEAASRSGADSATLGRLQHRFGDAKYMLADFEGAGEAYVAARRRITADPMTVAELALKQAQCLEKKAAWGAATRAVQRARAALRASTDAAAVGLLARCAAEQAWLNYLQGDRRRARGGAQEAVALADRGGAAAALGFALSLMDLLDVADGQFGVPEDSTAAAKALRIYEDLGDLRWQALIYQRLALRAYYDGRWDDCIAHRERALELFQRVGDELAIPIEYVNLAEMYLERGALTEADGLLRQAQRGVYAASTAREVVFYQVVRGRLDARLGRFDEAIEQLLEARAAVEAMSLAAGLTEIDARIAEVHVLAGQSDEALEMCDELLARAQDGEHREFRPLLLRLRGCLMAQYGDAGQAQAALAQAVEAASGDGMHYEEALANDLLWALLRSTDRAEQAAEVGARRTELFKRLGIAAGPRVPLAPAELPRQETRTPSLVSEPD